ncbi:MAG: RHS repeat-associated core domain-containing protein [Phycisphaerales bacterium]
MFASGYQADLDVNMDGAVDSKDSGVVSKLRGRSLGAGELSDRGNIVGWCGYLYEEATGMWLARHRWQIPELGRWANRDPLGYAGGGQNLYEYVNGNPMMLLDPSGLSGWRWLRFSGGPLTILGFRREIQSALLTGDPLASDEVYDSAYNTFANSVSDRINGIGRVFGVGALSEKLGGTSHIFDEEDSKHAECWARCTGKEVAQSLFDAISLPLLGPIGLITDTDIMMDSIAGPIRGLGINIRTNVDMQDVAYSIGGSMTSGGRLMRLGSRGYLATRYRGRGVVGTITRQYKGTFDRRNPEKGRSHSSKRKALSVREGGRFLTKAGKLFTSIGGIGTALDVTATMIDCREKCDADLDCGSRIDGDPGQGYDFEVSVLP